MSLNPKPELLLPAGSPEKLRYAVAYGADAVYLGLPMASLRTPGRGEQFTPKNLESNIRYAQERGVKAYVTINIFAANRDLDRVIPHLEQLETIRPDAVIFTDPGVFRLARKHAPSVPMHLSTQANTLNLEACAFWQDLGVSRVILAREVPYREIVEIHEKLPTLELECFVHGSLCVAYSGRCVISDYLTDNTKNSNKGMCGNSCRWEFNETNGQSSCESQTGDAELLSLQMSETTRPNDVYTFEEDDKGSYMLNSKDLCLVRHLRELQDAGIVSFKVEGRTKSVYYVATAGRIYREAIDTFQAQETVPEEVLTRWVAELSAAGNRGFTEGFFSGRPNREAYNYEDSRSHQTAIFLGTTLPDEQGEVCAASGVRFQARNPFKVGDTLDWITPAGAASFRLDALYDKEGFPVREAQTNHIVTIASPPELANVQGMEWSILRGREHATVAC
ncbi:MAG TPA: U32 family peptidase C-terminal domain-containing protein [Coleofasciculaceae cyanobacterium]|jgi:putative protease